MLRRNFFAAFIVPSSPILVTLMMEALHSFETLVFTRATWLNIPEDGILLVKWLLKLFDFSENSNIHSFTLSHSIFSSVITGCLIPNRKEEL
jgi:hypothetical protein